MDLPLPRCRCYKARASHQSLDGFLIARKPEEQIHFIAPFQGPLVHRTAWIGGCGRIVFVLLTGDAIPTLLAALPHIAIGLDPRKELFDDGPVAGLGGTDEVVVADLPALPEILKPCRDGVAMGLGGQPRRCGSALNFLPMLITARNELHLQALQSLEAGDRITGQGGVGAAQMGAIVDVVEGRGEGEGHQGVARRGGSRPA